MFSVIHEECRRLKNEEAKTEKWSTPSVNNRNERAEHGLLKRKTAFYDGNKLVPGMELIRNPKRFSAAESGSRDVEGAGHPESESVIGGICKAKEELQAGFQRRRGQRLWLKLIK